MGVPTEVFDGSETVTAMVDAIAVQANTSRNPSSASPEGVEKEYLLSQDMNVTFYHCPSGNIWNYSDGDGDSDARCHLCNVVAKGQIDVSHLA